MQASPRPVFALRNLKRAGDKENLRLLVLAVVTRDAEAMAELYFDMGVAPTTTDHDAFVRDLSKALEQY